MSARRSLGRLRRLTRADSAYRSRPTGRSAVTPNALSRKRRAGRLSFVRTTACTSVSTSGASTATSTGPVVTALKDHDSPRFKSPGRTVTTASPGSAPIAGEIVLIPPCVAVSPKNVLSNRTAIGFPPSNIPEVRSRGPELRSTTVTRCGSVTGIFLKVTSSNSGRAPSGRRGVASVSTVILARRFPHCRVANIVTGIATIATMSAARPSQTEASISVPVPVRPMC
jgi:hypothetical protein